jgi:serine kinase of HPr protein (carbohydrate metabolism regulator)
MLLVHGTCVAIEGAGVLLRGPSGSGKSDLALRLIETGATLVADDQVILEATNGEIRATAPPALANLLEVRGVGIIEQPTSPARLTLLVDLVTPDLVPRLPEPRTEAIDGAGEGVGSVDLPVLMLAPFETSAPNKVRQAVALLNS